MVKLLQNNYSGIFFRGGVNFYLGLLECFLTILFIFSRSVVFEDSSKQGSEAYFGLFPISTMELFNGNSQRLKTVNYFHNKLSSMIFDKVLTTFQILFRQECLFSVEHTNTRYLTHAQITRTFSRLKFVFLIYYAF